MRYSTKYCIVALLMVLTTNAFSQLLEVEKLNSSINSPVSDEMRPILDRSGNDMYFTRQGYEYFDRTLIENGVDQHASLSDVDYLDKLSKVYSSLSGNNVTDPVHSEYNQDIWQAKNINEDFSVIHHLEYPVNNAFPNSLCAMSADHKEGIVVNQFPETGGIKKGFSLVQRRSDQNWSKPKAIEILGLGEIEPDVNLALGESGDVLILSLQRNDSYGKSNDLYVSFRKDLTTWENPIHLGPAINSSYHEAAPYLSDDGKTLFFSSNRRGGAGGSDIYFVQRIGSGWKKWTAPKALPSPINSSSNESHPYFVEETGHVYFSSRRDGTSDIFRAQIAPPFSSSVAIAGIVQDQENNFPLKAIIISKPVGGAIIREITETDNGQYTLRIPKGKTYEVSAQKSGYLKSVETINYNPNHTFFKAQKLNFKMTRFEDGTEFVMEKVHFQKSTSILLTNSFSILQKLGNMLTDNPYVKIKVEGHTDNVGTKESLFKLSEERAESIRDYLIHQYGIQANRIKTIGLGDSNPLNGNETETEREKNRRVEIRILHNTETLTAGTK